MNTYGDILGLIASICVLVGPLPYIRGVLNNTIKPHAFTWLVFGAALATGFGIQISEGAGAGSWSTGAGALSCLTIFVLALRRSDRVFSAFDWICLFGAGLSFVLWRVTDQPMAAVILLSLTDIFGFLPTFRTGFRRPHEEGVSLFVIGGLGTILSLLALEKVSPSTWLYPATMIATNSVFVTMILLRRKATRPNRAR